MFEVKSVKKNSPAERCGIMAGDSIVSVNGEELTDYIDYIFFCAEKRLNIKAGRSGRPISFKIRKEEQEDPGLDFTRPMLGNKRVCSNKCIFCFVDQLPKGMRKSLYIKDEDWRYSLIMGNFVTLSSTSEEEIKRIIRRKASPLYISVHTVDEELRRQMLGNRNSNPIKPILKKFSAHGIGFHSQVVVCPGFNDKEMLEETYRFLKSLHPAALSLAIVPVGLTAYRQGCKDISPVTKKDAEEIIGRVENWQKECLNSMNTRFVYAADELYIRAGLLLPPTEEYEAYPQIENGVGLLRKFTDEAESAAKTVKGQTSGTRISVATGEDAYPFIKETADKLTGGEAAVYMVKNITFGGGVTVSGLLAGKDYLAALSGKDLGEALLISADSLREGVFLDDMKLTGLEEALNVKIIPIADGYEFAQLLCGAEN